MSKENKSRYAILGLLSLRPMSGYDLKKFTEEGTSNFWQENYAQIYPMLRQLTAEGLATSHIEKQEKRPERHIYEITEQGIQELYRWLAEPVEQQVGRNELLLKLFFAGDLPFEVSIEHIQRFRQRQERLLQHYQDSEQTIRQKYCNARSLPYWLMTLSYGKHNAQAILQWCEESLAMLEQAED